MSTEDKFIPPGHLRGAYVQTILSSSRLRTLGPNPMLAASREMILDAADGVRLQGFYSPQPGPDSKGLVILLHGWEGSAASAYILHTGKVLYTHGYEVFRLNFRDHGPTHHLNQGMFYGTLLDEVFSAVKQATGLARGGNAYLAGFSLGGNFALRIARRCAFEPIDALRQVLAVSPAIDPGKATDAIDRSPLLRWYFLKKWRRSLQTKQCLHPGLYDFTPMLSLPSIRALTSALIRYSGVYHDADEYFRGYTIDGSFLEKTGVPATIVIAQDDPAIPVEDFRRLRLASRGKLIIHTYGGHNGFLYGLRASTWYEKKMLDLFRPDDPS